jgi:hypothetical protein
VGEEMIRIPPRAIFRMHTVETKMQVDPKLAF